VNYASVLLLLAALTLTGAGLASILVRPRSLSMPEFFGLAFLLGFGMVGLISVLVMLAGGQVMMGIPVTTALLGAGLFVWKRPPYQPASEGSLAGLAGKMLVSIAAFTAFILAALGDDPGHDVRAFWSMKARSIERHGTFRNPDFLGEERPHAHIRYPLLLPSVHALVYGAVGSDDGRAIRMLMAAFYVASLGVVGAALRERLAPGPASVGTAVFAFLPAVLTAASGGALTGYADYPLAIFLFLGTIEAQRWLRQGDVRTATLSLLAFACVSQMKLEGGLMAVAFLGLLPLAGFLMHGPKTALAAAVIPAIGVMLATAWRLTSRGFSTPTADVQTLVGIDLGRIPGILQGLGSNLVRIKEWGLLWPATAIALVLRSRRWRDPESLTFWMGALMFVLYILVWAALPRENAKDAMRHNTTRLVLHLAPLFFVWTAARLSEAVGWASSRPEAGPAMRERVALSSLPSSGSNT
jgi:hypothetical protein